MAKVLVVIDSDFRFSTAATPDFTFIELVNALTSAGHQVTKAHRGDGGNVDPNADMPAFNFATSDNLLKYDVIWMIGRAGRNTPSPATTGPGIGDNEIRAIADFMKAGGGVFATGDHDSIGAEMCGKIPRIRAMRTWYGAGDTASPMLGTFPRNFPSIGNTPPNTTSAGTTRADTSQRSTNSNYGGDADKVWFENQSDSLPQTITPTPANPAHPILRRGGSDIVVYPDHMHEGNTLGDVNAMAGFSYDYTQTLPFAGENFDEFPAIGPNRPLPHVIATGQSLHHTSGFAASNTILDSTLADVKTVNALSAYDGRDVGVGRIVTGSTFHHYIDINLTGDSSINDMTHPGSVGRAGTDAQKNHGFNDAMPPTYANIKAVFDNITNWLARPRPAIQLILERSTFGQAEANANPAFDGAIFVTVDGLKPNQFPGGGVTSLNPMLFQPAWAPTIVPADPTGLEIRATAVNSDDVLLHDRLQRLTFTYQVHFTDVGMAFGFVPQTKNISVAATLTSAAVSGPLTDSAIIQLVKAANPFMLDLANGNQTVWLSSDVKVFPVVAGAPGSGLVNEASRDDALNFLRTRLSTMTDGQFNALSGDEEASALSPFPRTTVSHRKVYNFAIARVRLNQGLANAVRVFFRIVPSPTTAALTYQESMGVPIGSYKKTPGLSPIALPGTNGAGNEWWSFPCFLHQRISPPESQVDDDNKKDIGPTGSEISTFFGALVDNNLNDAYLPLTPGGGSAVDLPTLMMGEHQCIVAQIEYTGTSIPDGANPFTSDKLSQRNLALNAIANPGLDASRMALHTFEIEVTPPVIGDGTLPDELLLQWHREPPEGTEVRIEISTWDAPTVVELADRFYPRHEIRAHDAHTIAVPGGGVRYVPIPPSDIRQVGIFAVHFPLGVKKGQRFDVSVHQVTTRGRQVNIAAPKATTISREEAARLMTVEGRAVAPTGVFDLGQNKVLITDLRAVDGAGDHAIIVEHPDPQEVAKAHRESATWRETIGAFQLGIPVSDKAEMLAHHLRLLSVLRWRAEWLRPNSRWYATFIRYVELTAEKVRALGGDPFSVPATPDGDVPLPGKDEDYTGCSGCLLSWLESLVRWCKRV